MPSIVLTDLISILDGLAPFALAESWDHSGLRLGRKSAAINGISFALDATETVIRKTASLGYNLLITHHPLMFSPQEDMIVDRPDTKAVSAAFELGVAVISCHTNLDSAVGGVNDTLASLAGLVNAVGLIPTDKPKGFGMGAVGDLEGEMSAGEFCDRAARAWNLSGYRLFDSGRPVKRAALCGGAGGDMWSDAVSAGAQLYATADARYHECLNALDAGLSLMVCDHGEMEIPVLKPFSLRVREATGLPVVLLDSPAACERHTCRWIETGA